MKEECLFTNDENRYEATAFPRTETTRFRCPPDRYSALALNDLNKEMSARHLVAEGEGKTDPKRATETKTALQIPNTALQARTQPSKLSQSRHTGLEGERLRWPSAGHAGQSEYEQLEPEEP